MKRLKDDPARVVFEEYEIGRRFKAGLGDLGMYEQNRRNERFFVGDQWHGAKCGGERPLVRHNVIKRIGDYKMAVVGASPIAVNYSAEGVPHTLDLDPIIRGYRKQAAGRGEVGDITDETTRINVAMSALSSYFDTTAERIKFENLKEQVLRDAYVSGTGYLFTYWDPDIRTGLYADADRTAPLDGDIAAEVLDVENVYMGDPNSENIQAQPYILIVQRKSVKELRREAKRNGMSETQLDDIRPDNEYAYMAGDRSQQEPNESKKATVITRLWKHRGKDGKTTVKAVRVCHGAVIRREWDLGIRFYPLASFSWQSRKGCAYGDSEITYLIPNQIAINRMITASVWAVMMMGIPITVVNGDVVQQDITNDPGQVLRVYGSAEDVTTAVRYVNPPNFSPSFDNIVASLINNTMTQAGASDAALGDVRPDNTSAIIAVREAATMPMQIVLNRFYAFIEDIARIWAEFWVMKYGTRSLKVEDENGVWYMPFCGEEFADMLINVKVEVGAAGLWSESQAIATLGNLLEAGIITPLQYVERLPKGIVANQQALIDDLKAQAGIVGDKNGDLQSNATPGEDMGGVVSMLPEEYQRQLAALPEQEAQQIITNAMRSPT